MVGYYTRHIKSLRTWATTSLRAVSSCYYFLPTIDNSTTNSDVNPHDVEDGSFQHYMSNMASNALAPCVSGKSIMFLNSWEKQYLFCYMIRNSITCNMCIKNDRQGKGVCVSSKQLSMYQLTGLLYEKHNAISLCHIAPINEMIWPSPSRFYY